MTILRGLAVLALALLPGCSTPPHASGNATIHIATHEPDSCRLCTLYQSARDYVVRIVTQGGQGAGVVLTERGLVTTNAHVVGEATSVTVELSDGRRFTGMVLATERTQDLALVQVLATDEPWEPPAVEPGRLPPVGSEVFVVGHPLGLGWTVTRGIVSGHRENAGVRMIQTDAAISPGNSGGALLDAQGHLVGIVTSKLLGGGVENVAFARPIDEVLGFLSETVGER